MADLVKFRALPPKEAIRFFKSKTVGARFTYAWQDMWREEHAAAFVVAKAMRKDILLDIYKGLEQALSQGQTVREFTKTLRPLLEKKGWWGKKELTDPLTGEIKKVQLGSPRRLQTIYDVNLRQARAAGRWERIARRKRSAPYLQYQTAGDGRVRPAHRQMDGIILPVDHPFWDTYYPPNGWRCRCIVRQLNGRQMKRKGLSVSSTAEIRSAGYGQKVRWQNTRTGKWELVPKGVDPAFAYNVGKLRLKALTPSPDGGPIGGINQLFPGGGILNVPQPRPLNKDKLLSSDISGGAAAQAFVDAFDLGPSGGVYYDVTQVPLYISLDGFKNPPALWARHGKWKSDKRARGKYMLVLADTLKDPDEIWVSIETITRGQDKGKRVLRRRYFARYKIPGENITGIAVFEEEGLAWRMITVFPAGAGQRESLQINQILKNVRQGILVYRKTRLDP